MYHSCTICGKSILSGGNFKTHMKKIHGIEALVISKLLKFGDGSFNCSDCVCTSKVKACVKIHIESKHIETGGLCQDCGKHVSTRNALKVHRQRNHPHRPLY